MKPSTKRATSRLASIRKEGLYRKMIRADVDGAYIKVGRRRLLNLSSNDYLGLCVSSSLQGGQQASSSRLLAGNSSEYTRIESALATHVKQEGVLVFPTGYMANLGIISTVAKKGDIIVSDELNHASIIDACKLSGAKIVIYAHNDAGDLDSKLGTSAQNKFVITEGVFSMNGDVANLKKITRVAKQQGASVILDDAHGDFVLGKKGSGTAHMFGVEKEIDIYTSSLSKALGSFGGYVAARKQIIDLCVNTARSFIYTSALPQFVLEHIAQRLHMPKSVQRKRLAQNVKLLHTTLDSLGIGIEGLRTHIAPIIVHDEKRAIVLGKLLYDYGLLAQAIRYPTVPKGMARIRLSVTAWPTSEELCMGLEKLRRACCKLHIA